MRASIALAIIVVSLMMGIVLTACSDDVGNDYYENETHRGYPGPGTTSPGRDS